MRSCEILQVSCNTWWLNHIVNYCQFRVAEKDVYNGPLEQGGKKLRSLGTFREVGRDLFEG